jgi:hypothetical protein
MKNVVSPSKCLRNDALNAELIVADVSDAAVVPTSEALEPLTPLMYTSDVFVVALCVHVMCNHSFKGAARMALGGSNFEAENITSPVDSYQRYIPLDPALDPKP